MKEGPKANRKTEQKNHRTKIEIKIETKWKKKRVSTNSEKSRQQAKGISKQS
ncbi:hypothetical protein HYE30_02825 [Mycoplasmopsis bovis]|nr:hypothetical protein [Mycoplasmopsis bovis]QQH22576.1 hypothetical protein HYE30_02825 [Mycoplasmopsis bovis]